MRTVRQKMVEEEGGSEVGQAPGLVVDTFLAAGEKMPCTDVHT